MSFGFGIGDIIACSEVAWKTISALKSAGSDFEGLRLDLTSLASVLQALEAEAKGPMPLIKTASLERQEQMRLLLRNCTESMRELQAVVGKYSSWSADKRRDFVAWMKFAAKDKRGPREKLAIHTASINIFLTTLSHGSLARLEFLIKNGAQAAHQGPVPDGSKDLDFSVTGAPWGGSHAKRKDSAVWQDIGRSLQGEGIADKDIEPFQEEIKAYARYLVRGETPFWREPVSKSRSSEVHRVAESISVPSALRYSDNLSYEEEIKRLAFRDEMKQARQTRYLGAAERTDLDPELRKAKIQWEEFMRRREEERVAREKVEKESKAIEEEDVVSLAYKFESLFDFDAELAQATSETPGSGTDTAPTGSPTEDDKRRRYVEMRNAYVYDIHQKIERLLDRRERYIKEGKRDKAADLEDKAIPTQVNLLKMEGVAVSDDRPWKWDHWCDACNLRISGDRYHCTQCQDGNWDACQECWDKGERCSGRGKHKITCFEKSVA